MSVKRSSLTDSVIGFGDPAQLLAVRLFDHDKMGPMQVLHDAFSKFHRYLVVMAAQNARWFAP